MTSRGDGSADECPLPSHRSDVRHGLGVRLGRVPEAGGGRSLSTAGVGLCPVGTGTGPGLGVR